ncbi:MAG TPA: CehA/McbA family metallohydrolase, partial [Chloroflexota bacterium]|nr:CehA/McbA family metallohydrolase [Chloroflexota bacterium]
MDYESLDLTRWCNANAQVLGENAQPALGAQTFHGLPFQIGGSVDESQPCFLAFGKDLRSKPLWVPIGKTAQRVIFAHRLLETDLPRGGDIGTTVAVYVFHFADGSHERAAIRERFEISVVPVTWGEGSFRAVPDRKNAVLPRQIGPWEDAGRRQTEVSQGTPHSYLLWAWKNPFPEKTISAIEIVPTERRFILAAITLGHRDEDPFVRTGTQTLKLVLLRAEDASQPFDLSVEVDRGVATYPYPLPTASSEAFLTAELKGWGEALNTTSSPAYVQVAAIPSATVTVKNGEEVLGSATWEEIEEKKTVEPTPRLRIEVIDSGRNWVRTTILDDETSRPVPCRIHFRSPEGVPYQPHGHHQHVNSNQGTWHVDVGGDLRLDQISYAYVDGTCEGWLPRGDVIVDAARGFEYEPLRTRVRIEPGQQTLTLRLKRFRNLNAERWFSGDTHVHFLSTLGGQVEARGEDLNVVNLLLSQWGHLFTNTEEFTGQPNVSADGRTIVYATQENRQHLLGHMTLLGVKKPIMPWCSDGPAEAELGGTLEVTMADWADRCHAQGGTVILPHFPAPNGEPAALVAAGRVDAVEMLRHQEFNHVEYYRYLNGGYRLPLVGGTDKMTSEVPVGLYRTYVHIPTDQEFTYDTWCRNLAAGRTFLSSGPLLRFQVNGHNLGDTVQLPGNGGTVEVEAEAESIFPIHTLQIIQQG